MRLSQNRATPQNGHRASPRYGDKLAAQAAEQAQAAQMAAQVAAALLGAKKISWSVGYFAGLGKVPKWGRLPVFLVVSL